MEALFAELFEAAGTSRRWGEILASRQGLTQAQWQTLWIAATSPLTVPQIARLLGHAGKTCSASPTTWPPQAWPRSGRTPTTSPHRCWS